MPTGRICKKETLSFITTKHISTPLFYQISQTVDHSVSIKYRNALLITIKIISNFMHGSHSKSSRLINHSVYTGYTVFCAKQFLSGLRLPSQVQSTVTLWNFFPSTTATTWPFSRTITSGAKNAFVLVMAAAPCDFLLYGAVCIVFTDSLASTQLYHLAKCMDAGPHSGWELNSRPFDCKHHNH